MSGSVQRPSVIGNYRSSRRSLAFVGAGQRRNGIVAGVQLTLARPSIMFSSPRVSVTVSGCAAFYSAVLSCAPESPVTISPGNMATCIRISPTLQIFTPENWMKPQFFRVAVIGGSYEESSKDDRKMQIIEHFSSSMDVRFNGNRLMYVPSTMLVQITGHEGSSVLSTGNELASAQHVGKTLSTQTLFTFTQLTDLDPSKHIMGEFIVAKPRQSVASISHSIPPMLMTTRRRQSSTVSTGFGGNSTRSSAESEVMASMAKDGVTFVKVACGGNQTVLLYKPGKVLVLGKMGSINSSTFIDDDTDHTSPCSGIEGVESLNVIVDVACGAGHIAAITEEGYLLTWGMGQDGCLGHGHRANMRLPRVIKSLSHKLIVHVACGAKHTVALAEDGDVFAWGDGRSGALGHALSPQEQVFESVNMPMEISSLKQRGVVKIACGDMHTAVVLGNGQLLTCGWSEYGRLGRASARDYTSCTSWFDVVDLKQILCTSVACGAAHTLLLSHTNAVYAFGWNTHGQLGLGDCKNRLAPTRVSYFETDAVVVTSIEAGRMHSLATTQDGQLFAWGSDELGQCGIGSFPQVYTIPHLVTSTVGLNVTQVAAGDAHSVMLATGSQRQLDVLESNHPLKYAQLVERYEQLVKEDATRRATALTVAKQRQREYEEAMRKRKPPLDRSSLARILRQQQVLEECTLISIISRPISLSCSSPSMHNQPVRQTTSRPRTANAILSSSGDHQRTAGVDASTAPRIRCSSATLNRQTRLFTFTSQQNKPATASNVRQQKRPQSAIMRIQNGLGKRQPQRSARMRQSIARALDQDAIEMSTAIDSVSSSVHSGSIHTITNAEHQRKLQLFPTSRPKSAGTTIN